MGLWPPAPHISHPIPFLPTAGNIDDLHVFDPATMNWTLLSAALDAPCPSARYSHGFTSAGGKLYVHGGYGTKQGADKGDGRRLKSFLFLEVE